VFGKGGEVDVCECGLDVGGPEAGVGEEGRCDGGNGELRVAVEVEVELGSA
jgi:hypothetical protein